MLTPGAQGLRSPRSPRPGTKLVCLPRRATLPGRRKKTVFGLDSARTEPACPGARRSGRGGGWHRALGAQRTWMRPTAILSELQPPRDAARRHPTKPPGSHARPKTLLPGKWREVARSPCRPRGGNPRVPGPGEQSAGWSSLDTIGGDRRARHRTARRAGLREQLSEKERAARVGRSWDGRGRERGRGQIRPGPVATAPPGPRLHSQRARRTSPDSGRESGSSTPPSSPEPPPAPPPALPTAFLLFPTTHR